jgi:hypothetical protein
MHMQIIKDEHITCDVEINNSTKANQVYYPNKSNNRRKEGNQQ